MAVFKCKMCGGTIEFEQGATVGICDSCGTKQTLPTNNDEIIANLHNRANALRLKCEFDKSEEIYNKILEKDPDDAEAHWGIILCKYGIEYVEDPKSGKLVPTCHRTSFEAILADEDYKAAIKNSSGEQQALYQTEAKEIDRIQKDILAIVKNEKPFDVFICYKETDENGSRTPDSVIANDIYYQLTNVGFKVFYAAITLEVKIGQEYEPYIFAALNSAKVMLAVGTKPEYFSAVWVKNEWTRFLKLMKTDKNKILIPCYKGMDAYELPEEFAHLQAQDMGKIGFINDLIRGIKKVVSNTGSTPVVKEAVAAPVSNTVPLLKRAFLFLEGGEFDSADSYAEKVLDIDPECGEAYLVKLLVNLRLSTKEKLGEYDKDFSENKNYKIACRFGDKNLNEFLDSSLRSALAIQENARLESIYNDAIQKKETISEESQREAAKLFNSIIDYKDSKAQTAECLNKAKEIKFNSIYDNAANLIEKWRHREAWNLDPQYSIVSLKQAVAELEQIPEWKDSKILAEEYRKVIETEQQERLKKQKKQKKIKKVFLISSVSVLFIIVTVLLIYFLYIIPDKKYNDAMALKNNKEYYEAYNAFIDLQGYKDSEEQAQNILSHYSTVLKNPAVGDYVYFGEMNQESDTQNNEKQPVEWIVIDKTDTKILLLSKYILSWQEYGYDETTWENSSIRKWLNDSLYNEIFTETEKNSILLTELSNDKNPNYETVVEKSTEDKIFLLNISEITKYLPTTKSRETNAINKIVNDNFSSSSYWLRTAGNNPRTKACVNMNSGGIFFSGRKVTSQIGVRPAMWVSIE